MFLRREDDPTGSECAERVGDERLLLDRSIEGDDGVLLELGGGYHALRALGRVEDQLRPSAFALQGEPPGGYDAAIPGCGPDENSAVRVRARSDQRPLERHTGGQGSKERPKRPALLIRSDAVVLAAELALGPRRQAGEPCFASAHEDGTADLVPPSDAQQRL